jgi:TorA maturation chaperone TorD
VTGYALTAVAERRSQIYWFLSRLFLDRPDTAFLSELKSALTAHEETGEDGALSRALARMRAVLADLAEAGTEGLSVEFTRLLRGIHAKSALPPPFESLHTSGPESHEATLRVVAVMAAAGFGDVASEVGPQDHIGAELRFLALLCFREAQAWSAGQLDAAENVLERQRAFLDDHILRWVPPYCERLSSESREAFYAAVADVVAAALDDERRRIDELLSECRILRQGESEPMPDRATADQ